MIQLQQRTSESPKKFITLKPLKLRKQALDFRFNLKQQLLSEVRQIKRKQYNEFNDLSLQGCCGYYLKEKRRIKTKELYYSQNKYSMATISKGEVLPTIVDWNNEKQNPEYLEDFTRYVKKQQVIK